MADGGAFVACAKDESLSLNISEKCVTGPGQTVPGICCNCVALIKH